MIDILTIKIKYLDDKMPKIAKIPIGDWIDLRSAEEYIYDANTALMINLGIAMELPAGHEAHVLPRGSTFENYGIIQTNSMGIVDGAYCGSDDIWKFPAYSLRPGIIRKYDRICQFRIMPAMGLTAINEVEVLKNKNRGGFGGTGTS